MLSTVLAILSSGATRALPTLGLACCFFKSVHSQARGQHSILFHVLFAAPGVFQSVWNRWRSVAVQRHAYDHMYQFFCSCHLCLSRSVQRHAYETKVHSVNMWISKKIEKKKKRSIFSENIYFKKMSNNFLEYGSSDQWPLRPSAFQAKLAVF